MSKYPAGTLVLDKIQDGIYDWIKSITQGVLEDPDGVQIIWRNQSKSLPPRPFVSLKLIDGPTGTDRDPSVFTNAVDESIVAGMQQEGTLSVQVFGNTKNHRPLAHQLCLDINSSLLSAEVRRGLHRGGVAIQGKGQIQNLTALEETEYEERYGFDLALGMVQNIVDESTTIQEVKITGTVDDDALPTQTITLP